MSRMGPTSLTRASGDRKLPEMAPIGIGVEEAVAKENILEEASSSDFRPPASKPTSRGRSRKKREALSPDDALDMLKSALYQVQQSGIQYAVVALNERVPPALGIVLGGVWACEKCRRYVFGGKSKNGRCETCNNN